MRNIPDRRREGGEVVWIGVGALAAIVIFYVLRNGKRNADPLNRKAAAEICEYLTSPGAASDPAEIVAIFQRNARYRKQARHVASMIPSLLSAAGMPWEIAKSTHATVLQAADLLPD